ncbi:MAG TPA: helix-turn-helix transcriptional regulator [Thermoanaerobaculia bacterium]|nr:helix-turn-helix transcriptional regulator [Thermoanaerobaculia bacterium]
MVDATDLESLVVQELRRAIALDGRSLNAVGRAAGFSQGYLSQLLRGRQDLKVQHVARVLAALDVRPGEFFRRLAGILGEPRGESTRDQRFFKEEGALTLENLRQTIREVLREEWSRVQVAVGSVPAEEEEGFERRPWMGAFETMHGLQEELEDVDPVVASEVEAAEELYGELVRLEVPEQLARVKDAVRYRQAALAQRFLSAAREAWNGDPRLAHDRAAVGAAVADLLDPATYHPQWLEDLRAKARAYLANTNRILAEFQEAEREFFRAEQHLRRGVGSGRCQAEVFSLKASLLIDQDRFVEAGALLREVEAYYERAGERRELARTQLKAAMVAGGRGDYQGAAQECARAYANLDPRRDRSLSVLARQNAVDFLVLAGDPKRARSLFDSLPPAPGRSMALRRKWVEGNLLRAEGRHEAAMEAYEEARRGYREDGRPYYTALIALEQALAAFDMGDTREMAALVEDASVLLVKAAAKHQTVAVLQVLLTAIERGTVDRALLVSAAQRAARFRPS